MISLWDHQSRGLDQLRQHFRQGARRGCLVIPTGGGKTRTGLAMTEAAIARGKRVLFIADRRVLVKQAARAAQDLGLPVGVLMRDAGVDWYDPSSPLQVCSKDSLVSWLKNPDFDLPPADLLLTDECHKADSATWEIITAAYPNAHEVGMTATPCKSDNRGLGHRYDFLVQPTSYQELIQSGVLVEPVCYAPSRTIDPDKSSRKKPSKASMTGDVVGWYRRLADGLRAFVYATDVRHSLALMQEFRAAGINAAHIDAKTPDDERDEILAALDQGTVQVVCNCAVLRYGVDVPAVECCQIVAPMGSIVDYRQSVGRVLRSSPGKSKAVVIDHAGAVLFHGFPHSDLPWALNPETDHRELSEQRRKEGKQSQPIACAECHALFAGQRGCPGCGWQPQRQGRPVKTRSAALHQVEQEEGHSSSPANQLENLNRVWRMCLAVCCHKGQAVNSACAMFKNKTGRMPLQAGVDPVPVNQSDWKRPASEVFPNFVKRK